MGMSPCCRVSGEKSFATSLARTFLSFAEAHQATAQADQVTGTQPPRSIHALVVDPRPARRALVAQHKVRPLVRDAGVNLVHRRIAEQPQIAALGPANGHFRTRQQQLASGPETGFNLEPGL